MNGPLWIVGSGKMARNLGGYFLGRGVPVCWISPEPSRLADARRTVETMVRRSGDVSRLAGAYFSLAGDASLPAPSLILECTSESAEAKRAALARLGSAAETAGIWSASSSLLPSQIHPRCVGAHFFYPAELTGLVEVIEDRDGQASAWLAAHGFQVIRQTAASAFALNRLLLPVQNECLQALFRGCDPAEVDAASANPLVPVGQLSLMDSVGLDVVSASVVNYLGRMGDAARGLEPLRDGLARLVAMGKQGRKNRDGLLSGRPLPWPAATGARVEARGFYDLLRETCGRFIESGWISEEDLMTGLTGLYHCETSLAEARARP